MEKKLGLLLFGIVFGFTLSRVGASNYDLIVGMFTGRDLTLAWVMITAIIIGGLGMQVLKRYTQPVKSGEALKISHKKLGRFSLIGAAIFGVGWGISGACPGTVLAQLGEGKIYGLFTFLGMIGGTYLYALIKENRPEF